MLKSKTSSHNRVFKRRNHIKHLVLFALVALVIMFALVFWAHFLRKQQSSIKNVILISIDTCRADHLSCYGFNRETTPNIDAFATEGIMFINTVTPVPLTLPAHCSMFTGVNPPFHQVHDNLNNRLGDASVTLAEILNEHGYQTTAVVSAFVLDRQFGINQGFDNYYDKFDKEGKLEERTERPGKEVTQLACQYLENRDGEPFFLFLHYFDPHADYNPPEPFKSRYADDLYSGEIAYADCCVGKVIEKLKALDLYDSTLIVVTGDHGEALGEHGEIEHGYFVYQSTLRVPLIIRVPGQKNADKITDVVSLIDIMPTVLGYLDISVPEYIQGQDLSAYSPSEGRKRQERYVYCESLIATRYGCNPLLGMVGQRWKFIQTTRSELYDLLEDPDENKNVLATQRDRASLLADKLQEVLKHKATSGIRSSHFELDDAARSNLESLGYVGAGANKNSLHLDEKKLDPKDFISYYEHDQDVIRLMHYKKFDQAKATCREMLSKWPSMANTFFLLGRIAFEEEDFASCVVHNSEYVARANKAVAGFKSDRMVFNPNDPLVMARSMLGKAYQELGEYEKSAESYNSLLHMKPEQPDVHCSIAAAYIELGQMQQAIKHCKEALRFQPDYLRAYGLLGAAHYRLGDYNKSAEQYEALLQSNPNSAQGHSDLAGAYWKLGKRQQAIQHWETALQLQPNLLNVRTILGGIYFDLGQLFYRKNNIKEAVKQWYQAARIKSEHAELYNNLAWIIATTEDETLHNPTEAVRLAEKACELTDHKNPEMLETLATVYASNQRFGEAVAAAQKAHTLATNNGQMKLAARIQEKLELFRDEKPFAQAQ